MRINRKHHCKYQVLGLKGRPGIKTITSRLR
jgi:hypothetical protein